MGPIAIAWEICKKDLRIERRTGEIVATATVFSIVVGFLASMAFSFDERSNPATAAGTLWITIFFAAVLSFGRVWQRERDESALTGLLVAPIARGSIFLGKAVATFGMILVVEVPLVLLLLFVFHIDFARSASAQGPSDGASLPAFLALLVLGTLALSFVGTLFGAMTVRTSARDLVLAIVLFPLLSPVLVCGVVGTRRAFELQPFDTYSGFLALMGAATLITLLLGVGLFGALVDD